MGRFLRACLTIPKVILGSYSRPKWVKTELRPAVTSCDQSVIRGQNSNLEVDKRLVNNRSAEEIKYNRIKTCLRSEMKYNDIPFHVRNKKNKDFKLSYKRYRNDLTTSSQGSRV